MHTIVSEFGSSFDNRAEVVLLCPHGEVGDRFIEEHRIAEKVASPRDFADFVVLDADRGSFELAHLIAKNIVDIMGDVLVRVIEVGVPRSVLDCNRVCSKAAVRNILDWNEYPELESDLTQIHEEVVQGVFSLLGQKRNNAILLDVHTMAAHSPLLSSKDSTQPALVEEFSDLGRYVKLFNEGATNGQRRNTNFITALNGMDLADPVVLHSCFQELAKSGVTVDLNLPYSLAGRLMSTRYALAYRSLTIDFNKGDLLSSTDLIHSTVDLDRVARLASPVARGLATCFK